MRRSFGKLVMQLIYVVSSLMMFSNLKLMVDLTVQGES